MDRMPRSRDKSPPAVRVYTVCDESRYLIVRNVPSINCGEELARLFASYGPVEECWMERVVNLLLKFIESNSGMLIIFAKRKLDEVAFYGNVLHVSYATHFETLSDTKAKLEGRRTEVLSRLRQAKNESSQHSNLKRRKYPESVAASNLNHFHAHVSSNKDYFSSPSMNKTVRLVREKLDMIASSGETSADPGRKKPCTDNRRRI